MGPVASPWIVSLVTRRWLAMVVLPLGLSIAIAAMREDPPAPVAPAAFSDRDDTNPEARVAWAHRRWVADHGAGCARSAEHLRPYLGGAWATDEWGLPLVLTCVHHEPCRGYDMLTVSVTGAGPDHVIDTEDDVVAVDHHDVGGEARLSLPYCSALHEARWASWTVDLRNGGHWPRGWTAKTDDHGVTTYRSGRSAAAAELR